MELLFTPAAELPPNFAPPEVYEQYGAIAELSELYRREAVGVHPRGTRWSAWPFCFEEYISDEEPNLEDSREGVLARNRFLTWKRITREDVPEGWHAQSQRPWRIDGFYILTPRENYLHSWQHGAQSSVRRWQRLFFNKTHHIEEISFEEFASAYKNSTVAKKVGTGYLETLIRKWNLPSVVRPLLWGVRDKTTGKIIAGTAVHYLDTQNMSVRECSFILPEAKKIHATAGLMDYWFAESLARNSTLLYFVHMRQPDDPKEWEGYSEFKSHFGLHYYAYPPALVRFVRGKLF